MINFSRIADCTMPRRSSKRVRVCGHWVNYDKYISDMFEVVLCNPTYFQNIIEHLDILEIVHFIFLSKFHKNFIYDKKNTRCIIKIMRYKYNDLVYKLNIKNFSQHNLPKLTQKKKKN